MVVLTLDFLLCGCTCCIPIVKKCVLISESVVLPANNG